MQPHEITIVQISLHKTVILLYIVIIYALYGSTYPTQNLTNHATPLRERRTPSYLRSGLREYLIIDKMYLRLIEAREKNWPPQVMRRQGGDNQLTF